MKTIILILLMPFTVSLFSMDININASAKLLTVGENSMLAAYQSELDSESGNPILGGVIKINNFNIEGKYFNTYTYLSLGYQQGNLKYNIYGEYTTTMDEGEQFEDFEETTDLLQIGGVVYHTLYNFNDIYKFFIKYPIEYLNYKNEDNYYKIYAAVSPGFSIDIPLWIFNIYGTVDSGPGLAYQGNPDSFGFNMNTFFEVGVRATFAGIYAGMETGFGYFQSPHTSIIYSTEVNVYLGAEF